MRKDKHFENERQIVDSVSKPFLIELRQLVKTEREETMMSMPAERVMRALNRSVSVRTEEIWISELVSWFRPVFVAGLLVVVALAFYNVKLVSADSDSQQTAAEMVLGLPPITIASAYDFGIEDHH